MPGQACVQRPPAAGKEQCATSACTAFLKAEHSQDLLRILTLPGPDSSHSLTISFLDLCHFEGSLANSLLRQPQRGLACLITAAQAAQGELAKTLPPAAGAQVKSRLQVRIAGLVNYLDSSNSASAPAIGQLRSSHVHSLLTFSGTIVRAGAVQTLEVQRLYECKKCKHRFYVAADLQQYAKLEPPTACPVGGGGECKGTVFRHCDEVPARHADYQEVRVQERAQCLRMGAMPRSVTALLLDDLADACQAGDSAFFEMDFDLSADDVEMTGVVLRRWKPLFPQGRCTVELTVLASSLVRSAQKARPVQALSPHLEGQFREFWDAYRAHPFQGRNQVVASICPQLHGLASVKLALLLLLWGGVARQDPGGSRVRGTVHMLLVGDPGTGKSQIMKYAAQLSPRAVVTSGRGSSSAGLTATAVKEGGQWSLAAGALVLADGGLCCIDEFDGLKEVDRTAIHEAMEQQTISVAKAGLVTTLSTCTAVLGVQNPKGQYDPRESLAVNTSLSEPLLSRFDIVLVLRDLRQPDWDAGMCEHLLGGEDPDDADGSSAPQEAPQAWPVEALKQYIAWVRASFRPVASPEAEQFLLAYWNRLRGADDRQSARTTVRALESLVRLSQAHARLMCRHTVLAEDAVAAILVVEESMQEGSVILGGHSTLHTSLPEDPDAAMRDHQKVLEKLLFLPEYEKEEGGGGGGGGGRGPEQEAVVLVTGRGFGF